MNNINEFAEYVYEEIKSKGYSIEDIVSGDVIPDTNIKEKVDKLISLDNSFYSNLLRRLVSEEFDEETAKKLWFEILDHKYKVSEKLGRNIGVRVATLDYLENIKKIVTSPKIIEEKEFLKTLRLATKDPLTGLYNRMYLFNFIVQKIRQKQSFSIAFLDLDGFKRYNDREGHQAGDVILHEFAAMIKLKFNDESRFMIGRYGGDEFIICLLSVDKEEAKDLLDEFRQAVQEEFSSVGITVSIGVCEYNSDLSKSDARDFEELIERADELLYRVKEFGGNKVFILKTVIFNYEAENNYRPKEVAVVGDFNNWDRKKGIMEYSEENKKWFKKVLLKPGTYRYKFLIDTNLWAVDKTAKHFVDDGFGGQCAVVVVDEK